MSRPQKSRVSGGGMWRQKRLRFDEPEGMELDRIVSGGHINSMVISESTKSFADELGELISSDEFENEVAHKTNTFLIGRQEAETEVFTDILVKRKGDTDHALLYVVSTMKVDSKISVLVNNLINRGAYTSTADTELKTPLHHAVERGLKGIAATLLENDAHPHARDRKGKLPLQVALDNKDDEMGALILAYMKNSFTRSLFLSDGIKSAEFSLHELLAEDRTMQKTILSVLDCLMETRGSGEKLRVFYSLLECDEDGRQPDNHKFECASRSPLQLIAKQGNKNIVYHDAVRLLIRRKWKHYAKRRFEYNSFLYILGLICVTYSAIVAVGAPDPTVYIDPLHISRGFTEIVFLVMVFLTILTEINQLRRHKHEYFHEVFNYFDMSSSILFVCVVPLRFTHNSAQWYVFAFAYLLWTIRIFKFAAVFRQTGAYAQILSRVLAHDFIQFGAVFMVILLAFSGSFLLSLRGDNDIHVNKETSTFWGILFVGIRSLTESEPVVEYVGEEGYGTLSVIFMLSFLFCCIVILLNILIAQMSDTYQKVQQDAQRGLEVNRAWIIARVELNSFFFGKDFRKEHYVEYEDIEDVLTKWESPPINEMNKYVKDIWDTLDNHKMNLLTIQHRLVRQENTLRNIQDQLRCLIAMNTTRGDVPMTTYSSPHRPKFYRSNTEEGVPKDATDTVDASEKANNNIEGFQTPNIPTVSNTSLSRFNDEFVVEDVEVPNSIQIDNNNEKC